MFRLALIFALLWCLSSADWTPHKGELHGPYKSRDGVFWPKFEGLTAKTNLDHTLHHRMLIPQQKTPPVFTTKASKKRREAFGAREGIGRSEPQCAISNDDFYPGEIPDWVDYSIEPCAPKVKNQSGDGNCTGTCWAFATAGLLEYYHCRAGHGHFSFSEKYLVDCVGGQSGCSQGFVTEALRYVANNPMVPLEESYPYEPVQQECRGNSGGLKVIGLKDVCLGSGDKFLMRALNLKGPVAVNIWANFPEFKFYRAQNENEIFESPLCVNAPEVTHYVLVLGYGSNDNGDYWLIRNSWGTNWGWNGYVKLRRGKENYCRMTQSVYVPVYD